MSGADTPLDGDYVIALERLSKTFSGTRVLSDVSVGIHKNEIHALIGGNGSGKSTLIKILAGVVPPDSGGTVIAAGTTIAADQWTPRDARAAHLHFVHQDLGIFRDLSIADNLSAGGSYQTHRGRIRWSEVHDHARECLKRHGISADPRVPLSALNLAEQTMVAIVRALQDVEQDVAACVVLDEPTAALPVADARWLLTKLRELAGSGHAIMLVTHHMDEVLSCSDSVTILRDGLRVHTGRTGDLNRSDIIQMILGNAAPTPNEAERSAVSGSVKLKTTNLTSGKARQVSLTLRTGEILGLTGVLGSGFKDIPRALFGLDSAATGIVTLDGDEIKPRSPADAMQRGIAFLPGDRLRDGIFAELSVLENVTAASTIAGGRLRLRHRSERRRAQTLIDRFRVRPPRLHRSIQSLSGGNQQKVLLARWAARSPRLLLLDDPTSGVDVGARAEIWELLTARSRQDGLSILVSSSDVEELSWYCDRVLVFGDGRVDCELVRDDLSPSRITHAVYDASWKTAT